MYFFYFQYTNYLDLYEEVVAKFEGATELPNKKQKRESKRSNFNVASSSSTEATTNTNTANNNTANNFNNSSSSSSSSGSSSGRQSLRLAVKDSLEKKNNEMSEDRMYDQVSGMVVNTQSGRESTIVCKFKLDQMSMPVVKNNKRKRKKK